MWCLEVIVALNDKAQEEYDSKREKNEEQS
jgi:hypothetical protein